MNAAGTSSGVAEDGFAGTDVLVVGAGPVGLALAIELGHRGMSCLLVEKDPRGGHAPRAKTTHSRTREHLRRWGIADDLAAASPLGIDYPSHVHFVTRLGGHALHRFDHGLDINPARCDDMAEHGQWIPQYKLEAVLRGHAETLAGVTIRFGQALVSFEEEEDGVRALLRGTDGSEREVRARYIVGADGARSRVRDLIGAKMEGTYGLSRNHNVIFRAPGLVEAHPHGPGIMFWQINDDVPSLIGPMDEGDLWYFMPTKVQGEGRLEPAAAAEMIRRATGIDLDYEVLSSDVWVASKLLADRYRRGRAFLAGDACHLHPPFGGFGMLLGISDAVDLGWKIAAVTQGWGGAALLDSYEVERRQAHEIVLDAAEANHTFLANQLVRPHIEEDGPEGDAARAEVAALIRKHKHAEFFARGVVLGACYAGSPIIVDDGTQKDWRRSLDYSPVAIPGCRAPHRWMPDGSSLYDHLGDALTLLVIDPDAAPDAEAARAEARDAGIPLDVLDLSGDPAFRTLYGAGLVLVRPDQHVAWRGERWTGEGILTRVAGRRDRAGPGHEDARAAG